MITFDELHQEMHKITEISNVFLYLIENRKMCDSQITCDLFFDYVEKVTDHLKIHDTTIYSLILTKGDTRAKEVAENFLSGSVEIKKIFDSYLKNWSIKNDPKLQITNHKQFVDETREVFGIVLNRIQKETELLYPLIRPLSDDFQKVA